MEEKQQLKVGDKLFYRNGYITIEKIGRKYIYTNTGKIFYKEVNGGILNEATKFSYNAYNAYTDKKIYDDKIEKYRLYGEIFKYFRFNEDKYLSLEQLRKIADILDIK